MAQVVITDLDKLGVISDVASFQTPPNAWSSSRNVSFEDGGVVKSGRKGKVLINPEKPVNKIYNQQGKLYFTTEDRIWRGNILVNTDYSKGGNAYLPQPEWYITELSGVMIFTNEANKPQMVLPNKDKAEDLTAWGQENGSHTWLTSKIRAYKNFLMAIGMQEDGTDYKKRIRWSDLALPNTAPNSWDATSTTNSAGFNDLSEAQGNLIDGLPLGDYFMLYTSKEVFLVSYVGGNDIFSFRKVFDNLSILAPECVAAVKGGHFLVTTSDVVIHNGSSWESIINSRVRKELFEAIGKSRGARVKVKYYPAKSEVWILYSASGKTALNRAAVYNTDNNTWGFKDLPDVTAVSYGVVPSERDRVIDTQHQIIDEDHQLINNIGQDFIKSSLLVSSETTDWYIMDEGILGSDYMPCSVTKSNLDFDDWGIEATQHKLVRGIYPQFSGEGTVFISIGVAENPFSQPVWTEAKPFVISEDRKVDFRTTGRYISIKFEGFDNNQWSLLSYMVDAKPRGRK